MKPTILVLCTGNSCRSQMAEGWARAIKGDVVVPYSAGIEAHGLNPRAVKVMAEAGVDISGQRSKRLEELRDVRFEYVVTVCDRARSQRRIADWPTRIQVRCGWRVAARSHRVRMQIQCVRDDQQRAARRVGAALRQLDRLRIPPD